MWGCGKALTDVLPSSASVSGVSAPDSPGGASAFSEHPATLPRQSPLVRALAELSSPHWSEGSPSPFSGRKCNA